MSFIVYSLVLTTSDNSNFETGVYLIFIFVIITLKLGNVIIQIGIILTVYYRHIVDTQITKSKPAGLWLFIIARWDYCETENDV